MPGSLRFDLIKNIVEHGASFERHEKVDPSTSDVLLNAGVALVTTYIEQLSLVEIIKDAFPIFGERGGQWIGYQLTKRGYQLAKSENELKRAVAALIGGPKTEVSESIVTLLEECKHSNLSEFYREDFLKTLDEIRICFDEGCFIATTVLCGKILEVCLKEILVRNNIQCDPNAMMGTLIKSIRERAPREYLDPTLKNIVNIINTSRITAVHAQEQIPIPSRDQAIMVIFAMKDVVRRHLSHS